MTTLITPQQVIDNAFAAIDDLSPDSITPSDIIAATTRYIEAIVGKNLLQCIAEGDYPQLYHDYVVPALSWAVRYMVQPSLNIRTADAGLFAPRSNSATEPSTQATQALMRSIKLRLQTLLRRLSDHLNANSEQYEQYDPKCNALNRCSIYGGYIQIW